MKMFKGHDYPCLDQDMETSLFRRETIAYRLLKKRGFCERGVVPDFYGGIKDIDVSLWPSLHQYKRHRLAPDAIFIEYIANMQKIGISNFSEDNISRVSQILREFHEIGLIHGDTYPRNMMVVQQQPRDRISWLDFDCSQVVQRGKCGSWTEKKFVQERAMMDEFAEFITRKGGK